MGINIKLNEWGFGKFVLLYPRFRSLYPNYLYYIQFLDKPVPRDFVVSEYERIVLKYQQYVKIPPSEFR